MRKPVVFISIIILIAIAVFLLLYLPKEEPKGTAPVLDTGRLQTLGVLSGEQIVAEDDRMILSAVTNQSCPGIILEDKATGETWSSFTTTERYPKAEGKNLQLIQISTPINIYYTDYFQNNGIAYCGQGNNTASYKIIKDGVEFLFDFPDYGIQITVDVVLLDGRVEVTIPFLGIRENDAYGLISIDVFPVFDPSASEDKGYVFIPDGCGVIYNVSDEDNDSKLKTWDVFSKSIIDLDVEQKNAEKGIYNASVPVFGIKKSSKAFVGFVAQGEDSCQIKFAPSGYRLDLYRIYPSVKYRQWYSFKTDDGSEILNVDKQIIRNDFKIVYAPLLGEEADYSGMANLYRSYLAENGQLKKNIKTDDDLPVGIDFLINVNDASTFISKKVVMTKFSDVAANLEKIGAAGLKNVQVMLYGWQNDGYGVYPSHDAFSAKAGGIKELSDTAETAAANGFKLFAADNYTDVTSDSNYVNKNMVKKITNELVTDSTGTAFLLNPSAASDSFMKQKDHFVETSISGIAFDKIGKFVYEDYSGAIPLRFSDTISEWRKMMNASKKQFGSVAAEGANLYTYDIAERLYSVPDKSSQFIDFGESVPFLQMVLHGYISYSSEPGNLSSEIQRTKLKWIEYGTMPLFILTKENASKLKYTKINRLFDSDFVKWMDYSVGLYKELNLNLKGINDQSIKDHSYISAGVARVAYEGGTTVYVNYNDQDFYIGNLKVASMNYLAVSESGAAK
ncbi:MAG: DUF5696 domain-containing protein [Saccharofermentanales bacterium]